MNAQYTYGYHVTVRGSSYVQRSVAVYLLVYMSSSSSRLGIAYYRLSEIWL